LSLDECTAPEMQPYVNDNVGLNRAVGYTTPEDILAGRQQDIHAERDRKLKAARKQRQNCSLVSMQDEPEGGNGFSRKMSLKERLRMLGIEDQRAEWRAVEPGADAGVSGEQR
jgi:hypothetical protein